MFANVKNEVPRLQGPPGCIILSVDGRPNFFQSSSTDCLHEKTEVQKEKAPDLQID